MHAHAGKKGAFIFGNALENEKQIENLLFPRLIALNSLNFDFLESNFSDKLMTVKVRENNSRIAKMASREKDQAVSVFTRKHRCLTATRWSVTTKQAKG